MPLRRAAFVGQLDFLAARAFAVLAGGLEHARQLCRPGADRNAMQPSSPSSPSPMLAWRSRFEPSGVWESFRCSERTGPRRACARFAERASMPAAVRMS